ncbi:Agouti-related protein [Collichthys lucidus]|uniref:Agouti-related protein n=1 Tax=Collichthys lucidus TaxID=240159 RepID=A0A4U5UXN3_COLLU|nr:Agouti-related protein [Collichthys lucidus]
MASVEVHDEDSTSSTTIPLPTPLVRPSINRSHKHRSSLMTPARRCGRLMESCSSNIPCCDPCASCRCRLFNTICHCWRMLCLKKT